jgi:hypothetical protein
MYLYIVILRRFIGITDNFYIRLNNSYNAIGWVAQIATPMDSWKDR